MACGTCAKKGAAKVTCTWTDGSKSMSFATEVEAKAQVARKGGSYTCK